MADHSAADPASGYLFQCRYALLAALKRQDVTPGLEVSIECFDDIAFSNNGSPKELLQAKHSLKPKPMSDRAVQFWNTIGIWTKRVNDHPGELGKIKLTFVTTSTLGADTAVSLLRPDPKGRDVAKAAETLAISATGSKSKKVAWATKLFLEQTPEMREQIIGMVEMLDASPTIVDVKDELAAALKRACRPEHMTAFRERLEGWWFAIVIDALATPGGKLIPVSLIDSKIDDLRDEFGPDQLPIDYRTVDPSGETVGLLEKRPFVEQLKLIGLGPTGQKMAIVDYFRAREQRSRWTRDGLLRQNELTDYGRQLSEHWQRRRGVAEGRLRENMSEAELADIGMDVFSTTTGNAIPIREVSEAYVSQGSYHMLSDDHIIGWHPHYIERLSPTAPGDDDEPGME
ncbi:hypothetical protein SAMN05518668_1224 [Sphingobium sp. YR657]|uniref:ABC-three component system protein n=1 Tax=Sphingobium sp. YR657 TaxID=1884366 RepID=UPI0009155E4F|nr:ABC-three component system protein [Sphingobium sp. YR657]SHM71158.1 hypothetical protein SAMN05518668_1224 [Sphingobium sp. YR657]